MKQIHKPVLLQEVINGLSVSKGKTYIDATLGFGGHSEAMLAIGAKVVGIDQDETALASARKRLEPYQDTFHAIKGNFREIGSLAQEEAVDGGILADIGVSSYQLDTATRGFSFKNDGPLDMRMDTTADLTAEQIVNTWSAQSISKILSEYGEERFASRIADRIVSIREQEHIDSTDRLAELVSAAIPRKFWPEHISPATKTFQALRIAVNDELGALEDFLPQAIDLLQTGARLGVITFHSLEDRMVKDYFRKRANPCTCPKSFPKCICGKVADVKQITRRAIIASEEELRKNPRSRSAKLRIIEKL